MCRSIKTLFNFDPPATDEEVRNAALQFVRKLSGFHEPSKVNRAAFDRAVTAVAAASHDLLQGLSTSAITKNRQAEAERAHLKALKRFSVVSGTTGQHNRR